MLLEGLTYGLIITLANEMPLPCLEPWNYVNDCFHLKCWEEWRPMLLHCKWNLLSQTFSHKYADVAWLSAWVCIKTGNDEPQLCKQLNNYKIAMGRTLRGFHPIILLSDFNKFPRLGIALRKLQRHCVWFNEFHARSDWLMPASVEMKLSSLIVYCCPLLSFAS